MGRRFQRGSAMIEYTIICMFIVLALISGPNVILEILEAIREVYKAFTYSIGLTYPTPS